MKCGCALLAILAVMGAGCADHPAGGKTNAGNAAAASLSSELTLLQAATELGYTPVVFQGKTLYCKHEQLTGSLVPKMYCVDTDFVMAEARTQRQNIEAMDQQPAPGKPPGKGP
ncbi:MAG TPA: hypothetical protein VGG63_13860 [Steroidobacteraceae bacterium]|jgi:hypothetical protein